MLKNKGKGGNRKRKIEIVIRNKLAWETKPMLGERERPVGAGAMKGEI